MSKKYPFTSSPVNHHPPVTVIILEREPKEIKSVTKRFMDGRTLCLQVENDILTAKSMSFRWTWDLAMMKIELDKGAGIHFQHWEKDGLALLLTYFGEIYIGKAWHIDFVQPQMLKLRVAKWRDEVENDMHFPMHNVDELVMKEGYSDEDHDNTYLANIMYGEIMRLIADNENEKREEETNNKVLPSPVCDTCSAETCVWIENKEEVLEHDMGEHGHVFGVSNSTRRRIAYGYMFRVINGGPGQTGVRIKLPECVETGVRAVFPDDQYMGFLLE